MVYMTNSPERVIMAMEIRVKYCINARTVVAQEQKPQKEPVQHGITRGADYFRKGGSSRIRPPMPTWALRNVWPCWWMPNGTAAGELKKAIKSYQNTEQAKQEILSLFSEEPDNCPEWTEQNIYEQSRKIIARWDNA